MERLLWKKLGRDKKYLLLIWGVVLGISILLFQVTESTGGLLGYAIMYPTMVNKKQDTVLRLPDVFYFLPTDAAARRKLVAGQFWGSCFLEAVIHTFLATMYLVMTTYYMNITVTRLYWWKPVILFIAIFSITHTGQYYSFLKTTKEGVADLLVLLGLGKFTVCIWALLLPRSMEPVYWALYCFFALLLLASDIYYLRKYGKHIISYYADYDFSRELKQFKI